MVSMFRSTVMSRSSLFTPGRSMCTHTSLPRRTASIGQTPATADGPAWPARREHRMSKSRDGSVCSIVMGSSLRFVCFGAVQLGTSYLPPHHASDYVDCQEAIMLTRRSLLGDNATDDAQKWFSRSGGIPGGDRPLAGVAHVHQPSCCLR